MYVFLGEVIVSVMKIRFSTENLKCFVALSLPFFSAILLLLQLVGVKNSSAFHIRSANVKETIYAIYGMATETIMHHLGIPVQFRIIFVLFVFLCAVYVLSVYRSYTCFAVLMTIGVDCAFQFWIYSMVYASSAQREFTMFLLVLWGAWIMEKQKISTCFQTFRKLPDFLAAVICLILLCRRYSIYLRDIKEPYSNSKVVAEYINENVPNEAVILTDSKPYSSAILPYLASFRTFIYVSDNSHFSYVSWEDGWNTTIEYEDFMSRVTEYVKEGKSVYMVTCLWQSYLMNRDNLARDFPCVFRATDSLVGEDYEIYEITQAYLEMDK